MVNKRSLISLAEKCPDLLLEWDYENNTVDPKKVRYASHKKVWWICKKFGHKWKASVYSRAGGNGCKYCSGQYSTEIDNLTISNPELLKEWNYKNNGEIKPNGFKRGSHKKVWWICLKCGYEWKTRICYRTLNNCGCPACNGVVVTENNNITITHPNLCKEWHPTKNVNLIPEQFKKGSDKSIWWLCSICGYEWHAIISNRTRGKGCPKCGRCPVSKNSSKWLNDLNIPIENREVSIFINGKRFRVDAYMPTTNTIYEYFGNFWHGNPEIYNPNDINPRNNITFGELYVLTINRIKLFEESGYIVVYKWGN